jgi:hypothetical protein
MWGSRMDACVGEDLTNLDYFWNLVVMVDLGEDVKIFS